MWASQTLEIASPSITAALIVGGLTAELCHARVDWSQADVGGQAPISDLLQDALGNPTLQSVQDQGSNTVQVTLDGIRIMDRDNARVRFTTSRGVSSFSLDATVLDGKVEDRPEVEEGPAFGSLKFTLEQGCASGTPRVTGTAQWTDLSDQTHQITFPANSELNVGVGFMCEIPYIPSAGTLSWEGIVEGQTRSFTTDDAAEIALESQDTSDSVARGDADTGFEFGDTGPSDDDTGEVLEPPCEPYSVESVPGASWSGIVRGADWSAVTSIKIGP